ncbi:two-component system, regulatory protein [marine actinobacterium PHSC20C1]|nr:two-component system, regulatory protein [marine actinobacterium PHSC20C1]
MVQLKALDHHRGRSLTLMLKILVVEDDAAMGALVQHGLEDDGYAVTLVTNGVDALIATAHENFSAAAIDVMLPEMTGFEICRHLRKQGNSLPVLLLTARDAVEDRVLGLDSGADDYLTKPFAFAEFAARIRALVRRDTAAGKATLKIGELALDAATVRATSAGNPLPMSSKEFALLWMLATHPGEALTRSTILSEVWGTTAHIDANVVDQYVSYLRRKLEPTQSGVTISTVRGVGYALSAVG